MSLLPGEMQAHKDLQVLMKMPKVAVLMEYLSKEYTELRAHSQATAYFALLLDGDFSYDERMHIGLAALLHDAGKIPDRDFFRSPQRFVTPEEQARKRAHARLGFYIARAMGYETEARIVVGDQEWMSTDRYPRNGLDRRTANPNPGAHYPISRSGKERRTHDPFIIAAQQVCAVADVIVACMEGKESRPYRPGPMHPSAIESELYTNFLGDKSLIPKAIRVAERARINI